MKCGRYINLAFPNANINRSSIMEGEPRTGGANFLNIRWENTKKKKLTAVCESEVVEQEWQNDHISYAFTGELHWGQPNPLRHIHFRFFLFIFLWLNLIEGINCILKRRIFVTWRYPPPISNEIEASNSVRKTSIYKRIKWMWIKTFATYFLVILCICYLFHISRLNWN